MSVLFSAISRHARTQPLRSAISDGVTSLCYGDLPRILDHIGRQLHLHCARSRRVVLHLSNSASWALLDLALLREGFAAAPIPTFFTTAQRVHVARQIGAGSILTEQLAAGASGSIISVLDRAIHCVPVDREQPEPPIPAGTAKISYTSGSTGTPKGVCLSLAGLEGVAESIVTRLGSQYAGVHCAVLPLAVLLENVAGLYTTLIAGGHYHAPSPRSLGLSQPFQPDFTQLVKGLRDRHVTSAIMVPELLRGSIAALDGGAGHLPELELLAVGGATVSPHLLAQASSIGLPVIEGYGMTEMGSVIALNTPSDNQFGTVGHPLKHVQLAQGSDGELLITKPVFLGYLGDGTAPHILKTGDLGHIDENGRIRLGGRKSNVIITSFGRNVCPEWIESELQSEDEIRQAFVFGDGAPALGALIVPRKPAVDPEEIRQAVGRVNERLPDYAALRHWSTVSPFTTSRGELTENGRLRRDVIRDMYDEHMKQMLRQPGLYTSFFDVLVDSTNTARAHLHAIPQIQDALRGHVSLSTYQAYLVEAYHHVKHTVPLMRVTLENLKPHQQWLRESLLEYIAEETGHDQWILDDIRNSGGDPQFAESGTPRPATQRMVDYAYEYVTKSNAVGFFGMVFVLEGTSTQLATLGAESLMSALKLPRNCFRYLLSHGSLDLSHMQFFRNLMNKIDIQEDRQAIVTVANSMFRLFADMFANIPHTRNQ